MFSTLRGAARLCVMIFTFASMLSLVGCGNRAEELYETAQFEELQNNKDHARKLYQQIIRDHEDSPYAAKAKQRIVAMEKSSPE